MACNNIGYCFYSLNLILKLILQIPPKYDINVEVLNFSLLEERVRFTYRVVTHARHCPTCADVDYKLSCRALYFCRSQLAIQYSYRIYI